MMSHPNLTWIAEIIFLAIIVWTWKNCLDLYAKMFFMIKVLSRKKIEKKKKNTENPAFQTEFVYVSCI